MSTLVSTSYDKVSFGFPVVSTTTRSIAVVVIGLALTFLSSIYFDAAIRSSVGTGGLPGDIERTILLCETFAHGSGVIIILAVMVSVARNQWRRIAVVGAAALGTGIAADIVKLIVFRFRPDAAPESLSPIETFQGFSFWAFSDIVIDHARDLQSFPSAHTATAFGFAIGLTWYFGRGYTAFFMLASMAGLQRIVVGAHWTSDVIAGATLALVVAPIIIHFVNRWLVLPQSANVSAVHLN